MNNGQLAIAKRLAVGTPEWRRSAGPGLTWKQAGGPRLAAARVDPATVPTDLARIIRPEAQPRWLLPYISLLTPQYIETVLRGALLGNHLFQWQLFDMMEDTWPRLVKNLNEVKRSAIVELVQKWRLQPWSAKDEAPSETAEERAALVQEALFEMPGQAEANENGFEDTLYDVLDAWGKGTSLLEIEWETRKSEFLGDILAPKSTYWVHPKNYAWDGTGRLGLVLPDYEGPGTVWPFARTDLRMSEASGDLQPIVPDKFLVAICRARTGHPLGGALLRPLAWWWCAQNFAADWLLNFAQVFGMPIRWATYAQGVPQATIDAICTMLQNMGSQAWAAFPAGTALELKEAGKAGEQLPQASVIDRADQQCDLLVLGETLTSHLGNRGMGSRALGEVHERVRDDVIHAAASFLARVLNMQMIPAVLRLNYGDDLERPSFVPNEDEPEAAKANAEVLSVAIKSGIPVPVDFALEKLNIPKADKDEELVQLPAGPVEPPSAEGGATVDEAGTGNGGGELSARAMGRGASERGAWSVDPTNQVVDRALEELTGVQARWLAGVKPFFRRLVLLAKNGSVTDADFVWELERARAQIPELFGRLDGRAVAKALEEAMGSAIVNGAGRGFMKRKGAEAAKSAEKRRE